MLHPHRLTQVLRLILIASLLSVFPVQAAVLTSAPSILSVSPNSAPNNLDTLITIQGSDFQDGATVTLDSRALHDVTWVDSGTLTAKVPWGVIAGAHALSVTNPDGGAVTLADAFTLIQAIGVWTTDGPYGGPVTPLVVDPQNSARLFGATAVGLFRSTDGASTWHNVFPLASHSAILGLAIKPTNPAILLATITTGELWKSTDGGDTWNLIRSDSGGPLVYSADAAKLYAGIAGQFAVSTDDGKSWQGLSDLPAGYSSLAVDPSNSQVIYMGAQGSVLKSTNGGSHWDDLAAGIPASESVYHLAIDVRNSQHIFVSGGQNSRIFERSFDGGDSWQGMTASGTTTADDFAFSASQNQAYAVSCGNLYRLLDDGLTWQNFGSNLQDCVRSLAVDPVTGMLRYGGGGELGVIRSADGGQTWETASQGITALQPWSLAASDAAPEQLYVTAEEAGAFASADAAHSWTSGSGQTPNQMIGVAADPVTPCIGYVGAMWTVFKTTDCGQHWQGAHLQGDGVNAEKTLAVAVDPNHSNVILAGGGRGGNPWVEPPVPATGMLYRSTDSGDTWTEITANLPGLPINVVDAIAFSPTPGRVYLATGGWHGGFYNNHQGYLYISDNSGDTWRQVQIEENLWPVSALVVDPANPDILYAGLVEESQNYASPGGVFKSIDGGDTWDESDSGIGTGDISSLAIDPNDPYVIYAGSPSGGLFLTINGGVTWEHAEGPLGQAAIYCLASAAAPDRTFIYVCTIGGVQGTGLQAVAAPSIEGGVYQITLPRPNIKVYFPLARKN